MTFAPIEHEPDDYSKSGEGGAGEQPSWGGIRLTPAGRRFVDLDDPTEQLRKQLAEVTAQRDEWHRQNGQLRGERDAATERAVKAEAEVAELRDDYANLSAESTRIADRAGQCRRELAELRERIGGDRWRVRYQLGPLTEWTEPTRHETSARDWLEAFHEHYPDQPASLWHGYETQWREVPNA